MFVLEDYTADTEASRTASGRGYHYKLCVHISTLVILQLIRSFRRNVDTYLNFIHWKDPFVSEATQRESNHQNLVTTKQLTCACFCH